VFGQPQVPEVSAGEVGADAFVLDVREPDEWAAGHHPDAHHLPMWELPGRIEEVPRDRDIVVVCRIGSRSAQVVAYLRANGWDRTSNLAGGMFAWRAGGHPMVSEDGAAARVL
jgi:rhodanese-related sulfurtransferase